jgi:hypothetical protein
MAKMEAGTQRLFNSRSRLLRLNWNSITLHIRAAGGREAEATAATSPWPPESFFRSALQGQSIGVQSVVNGA